MVLDDTVDVLPLLRRIARFFRDESCGQCVPCRVGTVRQEELVARLLSGDRLGGVAAELALLNEIGKVMRDASICGLGQTALSAVQSAVKLGLIEGASDDDRCVPGDPEAPGRRDDRRRHRPGARGRDDAGGLPRHGVDTPTLCYLENLTPVNVCRVCVVEVEGSRTLVPACSRKAEAGMEMRTDSERVRTSRKMVLEFLASSVDMSLASRRRATVAGRVRLRPRPIRAARAPTTRPGSGTPPGRAITSREVTERPPTRSRSRSRSTTRPTSATTRAASSATSASRRAARTRRTRSPSRSPAGASTRASRPSSTSPCPTRPASTAATASASAPPAR